MKKNFRAQFGRKEFLIGIFLIVTLFFGVLIARQWRSDVTLPEIASNFEKAGEFILRDLATVPVVSWESEGDTYSITDNIFEGIDIAYAEGNAPKDEQTLKIVFAHNYSDPLKVSLGNEKTIAIKDMSATSSYSSELISGERIQNTSGESEGFLTSFFSNQKTLISEDQYLKYVSPDNRKTLLYSYGKDKALGTRKLKHWTLYENGTGKESEQYEIEKAVLRLNQNGGVDVFYFDSEAVKNNPNAAGADGNLLDRANRTLANEIQKAIEQGDVAPDFTIPAPFLIDKNGEQMALEWKIINEKTISWEASFDNSRYPVAVDPTLSFVAPGTSNSGAVVTGESGAGHLGAAMVIGDFNTDGRNDVAVSAPQYITSTGRVYIFYNDGDLTNTARLADFILTGDATSDLFGTSLAVGDLNADGRADLAVGAEGHSTNTGRAYVFYNDGTMPTSAATADVTFTGSATSDSFGGKLATGDFNADGETDLAVAARGASTNTGSVYLYYNDGSYGAADVTITGNASSDVFGTSLASGDVNGDTKTDVVVGASGYSSDTGRVYIFHNDGSIPTTAATADITIDGNAASDAFGGALSIGDFNADGRADIAVGASSYSLTTGRAYIFYNDGSVPTTAATADITITGNSGTDNFATTLTSGDVNSDGRVDLVVGAPPLSSDTGRVYIFYNDGSVPTTAATADVQITGELASDLFGSSVAVGDMNADGQDDLIVGAEGFSNGDANGRMYIFYSQNGQINTNRNLTGEGTNDFFGSSFTTGDFNSDGRVDLAVGAEGYGSDAGLVYVFYNDGTMPTGAASADFTISGAALGDLFGVAMTSGDLNSDGRTDIIVGARGHATSTGRAYIFYNDGSIPTAAASADVTITGETTGNYFGAGMATGDLNADGETDLVVGAERYSSRTGRAYMFYNDGSIPTTAATADVTLTGTNTTMDFGANFAVADFDADGTEDLSVGAPVFSTNQGRISLFFNDGTYGAADDTISGVSNNDFFASGQAAGDVDSDGDVDLIVGARGFTTGANTGRVYVYYNSRSIVYPTVANANITISGETNSGFGATVVAGDLNADGRTDFAVGGYPYSSSTGRAYIYYNDGSIPTTAATADLILTGDTAGDIYSNTMTVLDLTNDGKKDLVVGAEVHSSNTGRIYFYETKNNFSWKLQNQVNRTVRIGSGMSGTAFSGEEQFIGGEWGANNSFASSVALGDLNGDGKQDLAVGAPGFNSSTGRVYIFYSDERLNNNASSAEVIIDGAATGDLFGTALVFADMNSSGQTDLVVGAPGHSTSTGRAYIYYGDNKIPITAATADVTITGNATGDLFGDKFAVADLNYDGEMDVAIGARGYSTATGRAYIFYGDGTIPTTAATADITIDGNAASDAFGGALTVGDMNADARVDLIVGGYGYTTNTGRAYIFYNDGSIPTTAATADVTIDGNATSDYFGSSLATADLNFDGEADLLVGAYGYGSSTGRAYIFYGDGSIPTTAATADVTITGNATSDNFGRALTVGDINNDSKQDLVVGAQGYSSGTGQAYIFYNDGSIPTTAATADGTISGESASSLYGNALVTGDYDADGKTDIFVGASGYTVNTFTIGRLYLYTFSDSVITGQANDDNFGVAVTSGDYNSDGKVDLAVGANAYSGGTGRAYLFYADKALPSTAATADVIITGAANTAFGGALASADMNYDGKTDLIVGGSTYSTNTGRAYIFYNDGSIPNTAATADVTIDGTTSGDYFGGALTVGDVDKNNRVDLIVGASGHSSNTGRAYIFYNDGSIPTAASSADVTITGNATGDYFGTTLATGDLNSDSSIDLVVGAYAYSSNTGRVYIFNNDGSIPTTAATADTTITGDSGSNFGISLVTGDMNADSKTDLVVGATTAIDSSTGAVYLFYNDGSIPTTTATADIAIAGEELSYFGYSLAVGDVNSDGKNDLIIGNDYDSATYSRVYVIYNDGTYPTIASSADKVFSNVSTGFGKSISVVDVNFDGKNDIVTGDPIASTPGRISVFLTEVGSTVNLPPSTVIRGDAAFRGDSIVR
jgi:FG-GAP repeat/FG-GAP-like repeat